MVQVTELLLRALTDRDEQVRESVVVAREAAALLDVVRARLGWPLSDVEAALATSMRLGGDGEPTRRLVAGDRVVLRYIAREPRVPVTFRVLHEDARLVAVDKGPGFPVHAGGAFVHRTLLAALRLRGYEGLRPAHRLDRETSGVVLLARDDAALAAVQSAWQSQRVRKTYLAIVAPAPAWDARTLDAPIGKAIGPLRVRQRTGGPGACPARTDAVVMSRSPTAALVRCVPATGRLHQIRVHLAESGNPLIGDKIYGSDPLAMVRLSAGTLTREEVVALGHARHALHAETLSLPHPDGGDLVLSAPLPEDLKALLSLHGLQQPDELSAQPTPRAGR